MPYSFTQIEKDKSKTIAFVFSFLLLFYFLSICFIYLLIKNYILLEEARHGGEYAFSPLSPFELGVIVAIAFLVGVGHWLISTQDLIPKICQVLGAVPLDPKDDYHKVFRNILDEVSVATGGVKIDGYVIPTSAMNAFALADFSGNAIIGVTEGLLSRLKRSQIEAVVGHEAAHVVSGDCLSTTVATSLFEMYNGILRGIECMFRSDSNSNFRIRGSGRGGGGVLIIVGIIYGVLSVTKLFSLLINMFISREREYRADAVAVRLTRDPLSLAEALYDISYHWRGAGLNAGELSAVFIIKPTYSSLSEEDGVWADLFATHPPVTSRINVLLQMAHASYQSLEEEYKKDSEHPRQAVPDVSSGQPSNPAAQWMVNKDGQWQGPFTMNQLTGITWMTPETWVQPLGGNVIPAYMDQDVNRLLQHGIGGAPHVLQCPRCRVSLVELSYEGTPVFKCGYCKGVLVEESNVQRILIREDVGFSDTVTRAARLISEAARKWQTPSLDTKSQNLLTCPRCSTPTKMLHSFFSSGIYVEVDKCVYCGLIWFAQDTLEILQCVIESNRRELDSIDPRQTRDLCK